MVSLGHYKCLDEPEYVDELSLSASVIKNATHSRRNCDVCMLVDFINMPARNIETVV